MFDFRIITCSDGTEIIDRNLKTPYNALTAIQIVEYVEIDVRLAMMDRIKHKERAEAEHRQKLMRNPFYKLACMCRLI